MNKLHEGVYFVSDDHTRVENGQKIEADNRGALRGIKILRENEDNKLYEVSIHVLDESQSNWGDKVQMTPKPMKVISESESKIVLRGVGNDDFDNSFSDYGFELLYANNILTDATLKLIDRNIDIVYHKAENITSDTSKKVKIAIELLNLLIENHEDGDSLVRESDLKDSLEKNESFKPITSEITDAVNFINTHSNRKTISEGWIPVGGLLSSTQESSYFTEASKSFLNELVRLMK